MSFRDLKCFTLGFAVMLVLSLAIYFSTSDARYPNRYNDDLTSISSAKAAEFIGRGMIVEGKIAEIRKWRDYTFVNFDASYPKQTFTLIIPPHLAELAEALPSQGEPFSAGGLIKKDKNGKPTITATGQQTIDPYGKLSDDPSASLDPDRTGLKGMPY